MFIKGPRGSGPSLWIALFLSLAGGVPAFGLDMRVDTGRWLGTAGQPVVESQSSRVKTAADVVHAFTFEFPGVRADEVQSDAGVFTRFSLPDAGISGAPGAPELPTYRKQLLLDPVGEYVCRATVLEEKAYDMRELELPLLPLPARRAIPKIPGAMEKATLEMYARFYTATSLPEVAQLREIGIVRGQKLVLLEVFPVVYDMSSGRVTMRRKVAVDIVRTNAVQAVSSGGLGATPTLDGVAPVPPDISGTMALMGAAKIDTAVENRLLIVVADALAPTLEGFVAHKQAMGWPVDMVTTNETGSEKEAIRDYVLARYNRDDIRPSHLLLVGDSDTIPAWPGQGAYLPYTDLYYACMDGPDDWLPDMAVGRLPARTAQQLSNMVAKIVYYETSVSNTTPFVSRAAFASSSDNYAITEGTHNYIIPRHMNPRGYSSGKLYSYTYGATSSQLVAAVNAGRGLLTYSGHGYWYKWRDPAWDTNQVYALTNQWQLPVVASFACDTGAYADNEECFAEAWLRASSNAGGVAMLASSQDTYWEEDDTFEKAFFGAIFEDQASRLDEVVEKAKSRYLAYYGPGSETLQYFEQYNLLGDPSMRLMVLDGTSISDLAGATRDLPDDCLMTNKLFEVRLDVWVTNPPPSALIVKEKLPVGWTVTNATWNGNPMAPTYASGEYKWLFGIGTPVGSGTLRYSTQTLGNTGDVFAATGTLLYGTSNSVSTVGDQKIQLCAMPDTDGDGMPDSWELQYGLNPTNAADASLHGDDDGMSNLAEYLADTNPTNGESQLKVTQIGISGDQIQVTWQGGESAFQYLERRADLMSTGSAWQVIHIDVPPTPETNFFTGFGTSNRSIFYRIQAGR